MQGYPPSVDADNYSSGDDIVVEFLRLRFSFNHADFAQRVCAAAYRLGLVDDNELDDEETDDLVEDGRLDVTWDDSASEFAYLEPGGERALLELAPTPSWHELQFRRA